MAYLKKSKYLTRAENDRLLRVVEQERIRVVVKGKDAWRLRVYLSSRPKWDKQYGGFLMTRRSWEGSLQNDYVAESFQSGGIFIQTPEVALAKQKAYLAKQ